MPEEDTAWSDHLNQVSIPPFEWALIQIYSRFVAHDQPRENALLAFGIDTVMRIHGRLSVASHPDVVFDNDITFELYGSRIYG